MHQSHGLLLAVRIVMARCCLRLLHGPQPGAATIPQGLRGILQTDGYGTYMNSNSIGSKAMTHAVALRKFVDAVKVNEHNLESVRVAE